MAVKASCSVTLSCYRDTQSVTRYYKLQSSTASAPSKPTAKPPSGWTDSEPSYSSGSTNTLYFCDLTIFSDGTWSYSTVSKSSSYEAAKEAYNKAQNAQDSVDNMEIGGRNLIIHRDCIPYNAYNNYKLIEDGFESTGVMVFPMFPAVFESTEKYMLVFDVESDGNVSVRCLEYSLKPTGWASESDGYLGMSTSATYNNSGLVTLNLTPKNSNCKYILVTFYMTTGTHVKVTKLKLEKGTKATDWTPAPEDVTTAIEAQTPVITGTQTSATYSWTGVAPFSELKDGQKITYWLPYSCAGSYVSMPYWKDAEGTQQYSTNSGSVLNLTLSDGSTTGNIACYYSGANRLSSHFGQGNAIELTYKKLVKIGSYYYTGWWANANFYNDTRDNLITYFTGKTGAKGIWAYSLFMEDGSGTYQNICTAADGTVTSSNRTTAKTKIANTNGFKIGSSIYYTTTTYAANTNISGWGVVYSSYASLFDSRYAFNTELVANSLTPYKPIYLVGTIKSDGLFYLDEIWWTQTPTTEGKIYVLVGSCFDSNTSYCRITLYENNRWYTYDGTKLQDYIINAMISNVDVEYYLSTSATSLSGGSWQTTAPTWVDGKYMWSRTKIVDGTGNVTYSPSETGTCIAGAKGATGATGSDGKGVVSIVEQYYKSTSATSLSGGNWSTTYPGWENGKYIWTQSVITYTEGDPVTTKPVCVTGQKGDTGATGPKGPQGIPGIDLSQGKMLHSDPIFLSGTNSCRIYNNSSNSNVTVTRTTKSSDNPFANATHELTVTTSGTASPGLGGVFQEIKSRANAVFVRRIIAKIPTGYSIKQAENSMGTGYTIQWLTDRTGTGKFKEYMYKYTCGASATFGTGGRMYLEGTAATSSSPVSWKIAYCTTFDMTAESDVIEAAKTATNYMHFEPGTGEGKGLIIGDMQVSTLGKNVLISSDSVDIRNGETILASYTATDITLGLATSNQLILNTSGMNLLSGGDTVASFTSDKIELGKNSSSSVIELCGGFGTITTSTPPTGSTREASLCITGESITNKCYELLLYTYPENYNQNELETANTMVLSRSQIDEDGIPSGIIHNYVHCQKGPSPYEDRLYSAIDLRGNPNDGATIEMYAEAGADTSELILRQGSNNATLPGIEMSASGIVITASANANGSTRGVTINAGVVLNGLIDINGRTYGVNQVLWSGAYYMGASQTATLAASVSSQPHGIVLVWSRYSGGAQNYWFQCHFIPKGFVSSHPSGGVSCFLCAGDLSAAASKYVYISDTAISGNATNEANVATSSSAIKNSPKNFVLRYVIGV